jgi:hypothetical protein
MEERWIVKNEEENMATLEKGRRLMTSGNADVM